MLQRTPSELERRIGTPQENCDDGYLKTLQDVQDVVSTWIDADQAVERAPLTVLSLACYQLMYVCRSGGDRRCPGRAFHARAALRWRFLVSLSQSRPHGTDIVDEGYCIRIG